jgi:nitrite reductase/ring-hydroxylating ferredoxin subunit
MTEVRIPLADAPAPGGVVLLDLGRHRVGLYRVGDAFHVLADRCPHRGAPLVSAGRTVRGIELAGGAPVRGEQAALVRCPWHKWDFEIRSGRCRVDPRMRVRRYAVDVEGDELVISTRHPG